MPGLMEAICLPAFQAAAAAAVTFELKLRLVCDHEPATAGQSTKNKLEHVRDAVVSFHEERLDENMRKYLKSCVKLRNKLLHQELSQVFAAL